MSGAGRYLRYALDGASVFDLYLSVELAVGLAHLTGRTLAFERRRVGAKRTAGVSEHDFFAMLGDLPVPVLSSSERSEATLGGAGPTYTAGLDLANSAFVNDASAADRDALAEFAGRRAIFSDPEEGVFHLHGANLAYFARIFYSPPPSLNSAIGRIAPRAPFAALAQQVAQSLGRFNGARILVGDFHKLTRHRGYDFAREILSNLADTLSGDELLVISTDEPDNAEFFAPIVSHFTHHVFIETLIAGDFGRKLAELPVAGDAALAWIAHLVLRNALEFVGTPGDAFSGLTQRHVAIAQATRDLFFEARPFKFTYPGAATIDVPFESGQYLETRPGRFSWNRLDWPLADEMLSLYREWPESIPERGTADVARESAAPEPGPAASAAPPRRFTMSTTFQSAYVPPQLAAGRDPAAARRAVERDMQAIACDLMFGADRAGLVQRIVALGAPPAEAKRIIDSAYDDPLIANGRAMAAVLRKRDWLLEAMERQRRLWPPAATIERRDLIGGDEFLERFYAQGRPVILTGAMKTWNAMRWSPTALAAAAGEEEVVCRSAARRNAGAADTTRRMPFARFLESAADSKARDAQYLLADEHLHNPALAKRLKGDHGALGALLDVDAIQSGGMLWMGAPDALTPLHHDIVNSLVAQVAGRNRFRIIAAGEVAKLHNHLHVLSEVEDLDAPGIDHARYPGLADIRTYDVVLAPGEILYLPLAWWYQVRSESFAISATYTNFRWPNDFYRTYPAR